MIHERLKEKAQCPSFSKERKNHFCTWVKFQKWGFYAFLCCSMQIYLNSKGTWIDKTIIIMSTLKNCHETFCGNKDLLAWLINLSIEAWVLSIKFTHVNCQFWRRTRHKCRNSTQLTVGPSNLDQFEQWITFKSLDDKCYW